MCQFLIIVATKTVLSFKTTADIYIYISSQLTLAEICQIFRKVSSNFRLSDTEFRTRNFRHGWQSSGNDILALCAFEYRELSRAVFIGWGQATLRDRSVRWMLGLSINEMEARAFLIFLEE